jgi:hypothetical protein
MTTVRFVLNPAVLAQLQLRLAPAVDTVADETLGFLRDKLSGGGSGVQYPGRPRPSSAPGEWPAEQSGALLACLGKADLGPLARAVGALNSVGPVPPEAWALEYPAPQGSPVSRQGPAGARPWASRALADSELRERIRAALRAQGWRLS